jgi:outer membrane protein OmpA-like peptidoglycan-associated protein
MKPILTIFILTLCLVGHAQINPLLNKAKAKLEEKLAGKKQAPPAEEDPKAKAEPAEEEEKKATDTSSSLSAYRTFNFVRGSKIIFEDAFEEDVIGDYPKRWVSDAGGEVAKFNKYPGNWLRGADESNHGADYLKVMPTNFTLEFDIIPDQPKGGDYLDLELILASTKGEKNFSTALSRVESSGFLISIDFFKPWLTYQNYFKFGADSTNASFMDIMSPTQFDLSKYKLKGVPVHISIVRQDARLVLYVNTARIFDIRNAFAKNTVLNNLVINTGAQLEEGSTGGIYFSNILLAETESDNRKDMFVDGKYVTNAILFETNSDKLQPSSLSSVGVIANYLKENPTVKLKVIGHTDNVGEDASNLTLSSKRAASVVKELVEYHKIDPSRLSPDGKGETQPIGDNNTREGRALNRRVEFIKQ